MKKKPSLKEKYSELGQQSLIKVQYSCSGFGTDVNESDGYIPIVPEDVRTISRLEYLEAEMDDVEAIIGLLKNNQLPTSDLGSGKRLFFVARSDKKVIGCVALEFYGTSGLLRSLAVSPSFRKNGVARKLLEKVLTESRNRGISQLFLLTTTAEKFFSNNNWSIIERSTVPQEVAQSTEFSSVCPSSAICMSYRLH